MYSTNKIRFAFANFLFLIIPFNLLLAQKAPMKLGDVPDDLVKMTIYDKDPTAEAVVLCDYGDVRYEIFSDKYQLVYVYRKRIKILKTEGIDRGTVVFYQTQDERLSDTRAYAYNMVNGKVEKTKLEKSAIFKKKLNKNNTEIKFTIPNVKVGTVIEYEYEKTTPYFADIPNWIFQEDIPVEWSEFRTAIPNIFDFVKLPQSNYPFHIKEEGTRDDGQGTSAQGITFNYKTFYTRWVQKDVPAFKKEEFMACVRDNLSKLEHQLAGITRGGIYEPYMSSWETLVGALMESEVFGGYISKRTSIKEIVKALTKDKNTKQEKILEIFQYVKFNIKHNGSNGIGSEMSIKEVLEKKTGNTAAINLLLVAMLVEANINAHPILLSTRENGMVNVGYPRISDFNYVIAHAMISDEEDYLLDATDPLYALDIIDPDALNGLGLLILPSKNTAWVTLQTKKSTKSSVVMVDNLELNTQGTITGKSKGKFIGYEAVRRRKIALKNEKNKDEATIKNEKNKFTYTNLKELEKPLEGERTLEINDKAQINGDLIYLSPLLEYTLKENPFKQEERKYRIDYTFTRDETYNIIITLPDGYKVDEIPKNLKLKSEDGSLRFDFITQQLGENKLQIVSKFIVGRAFYEPQEYKMLKTFYAQVVTKQQEQVVLKKK